MAQPFEQSSKSLWGLEQVLEKQRTGRVGGDDDEEDEDVRMREDAENENENEKDEEEEDLFAGIDDDALMDIEG